ncbi:MAG TPA: glycosyl transferase, partial [Stellaceae bacterium]
MSPTLALLCLLMPGWAYLVGAAAAAFGFARRDLPQSLNCPPVTLLKPLHGDEPGLYDNLRSFAEQDYPAVVQMVLGVGTPEDDALPIARALIRDLPGCRAALTVGAGSGANRKVANLERMLPAATGR